MPRTSRRSGSIQAELRETDDAHRQSRRGHRPRRRRRGRVLADVDRVLPRARAHVHQERHSTSEAIVTLEQAQHISQRHLGLFNVEQSPLLDDITTAYLGLGNTVDAQKTQIERLDNAIRRFGTDDPRVIPFRYTLARYYEQSRLPESAREQYEEVLKSQESRLGEHRRRAAAAAARARRTSTCSSLKARIPSSAIGSRRVLEQNPDATARRARSVARTARRLGHRDRRRGGRPRLLPRSLEHARRRIPKSTSRLLPQTDDDRLRAAAQPPSIAMSASRPYTWTEIVLEFDVSAEGLTVRTCASSTRDPQTTHAPDALQPPLARDAFPPAARRRRARRNDERALDALRSPLRRQGRGRRRVDSGRLRTAPAFLAGAARGRSAAPIAASIHASIDLGPRRSSVRSIVSPRRSRRRSTRSPRASRRRAATSRPRASARFDGAIQPVVDTVTARVEPILGAVAAPIEPLLDAVAAAVRALRGVRPHLCRGREQRQAEPYCTAFHGRPP